MNEKKVQFDNFHTSLYENLSSGATFFTVFSFTVKQDTESRRLVVPPWTHETEVFTTIKVPILLLVNVPSNSIDTPPRSAQSRHCSTLVNIPEYVSDQSISANHPSAADAPAADASMPTHAVRDKIRTRAEIHPFRRPW